MQKYIIEYVDEFYNVLRRAHVECSSYDEARRLANHTIYNTPLFWGARVLIDF